MIVQNVGADGRADISFTVLRDELRATLEAVHEAAARTRGRRRHARRRRRQGLGRRPGHGPANRRRRRDVPRAGRRGRQHPDDHHQRNQDLGARRHARKRVAALRAVHQAFATRQGARGRGRQPPTSNRCPRRLATPWQWSRGCKSMEDLTIDDITLDESQARVTISGVPDRPGIAASVRRRRRWRHLRRHDRAKLRPRGQSEPQLHRAARAVSGLPGHRQQAGSASSVRPRHQPAPQVAKLSVSGIGMRSHTGVAIRMFRAWPRPASTSR